MVVGPVVVSAIEKLQHGIFLARANVGNVIVWATALSARGIVPIELVKVRLGQLCVSCKTSTFCRGCEFLTSIPNLKVKVMGP